MGRSGPARHPAAGAFPHAAQPGPEPKEASLPGHGRHGVRRGGEGAARPPAPGRENTWINDTLTDLYGQLHARGHAHSLECWHGDRLAGGLYGVTLGAAFFGESMFSGVRDASKVGAGASGRAPAPRRLPVVRYPVSDRSPGALRRHRGLPRHLSTAARGGGRGPGRLLFSRRRPGRGLGAVEHPDIVDGVLEGRDARAGREHPAREHARAGELPEVVDLQEGGALGRFFRRRLAAAPRRDPQRAVTGAVAPTSTSNVLTRPVTLSVPPSTATA